MNNWLYKVLAIIGVFVLLSTGISLSTASAAAPTSLKEIHVKGQGACYGPDAEWHFLITQVADPSLAPDKIWIEWDDGGVEEIPLDKVTGKTAHYQTTSHGWDASVNDGWTFIYAEWDGQFNISHRPCYTLCGETVGPEYGPWSDWAWDPVEQSVCRTRTMTWYDKYDPDYVCNTDVDKDCSYQQCDETVGPEYGPWSDWAWNEDHQGVCRSRTVTYVDKYTGEPCSGGIEWDCSYEYCTETTDWIIIGVTDWTFDSATQKWYRDITEVKYDKYVAEHECGRRVRREWRDHDFCAETTDWVKVHETDWQWDPVTQRWYRDITYRKYDLYVPDHVCAEKVEREWQDHNFCECMTDWVQFSATDWQWDAATQRWYRDVLYMRYDCQVAGYVCGEKIEREWKEHDFCTETTDWIVVHETDWQFDPQTQKWFRDVTYQKFDAYVADHLCDEKVEREWKDHECCQFLTDWVLVRATGWMWDPQAGDYYRLLYYEKYDLYVSDHVCDRKVVKEWKHCGGPGSIVGCVDLKGQQLKAVGPAPQATVYRSRPASQDCEYLTISGLEPGVYTVSAPGYGPATVEVVAGRTAKVPWECMSSRPFQLESGLSPGLTRAVVESSCPCRQEDVIRKQEELAQETGWTGDPCPEVRDDYLPDFYHTSAKMFWATGHSKDIPERGLYFKITGLYERTMGALVQFAGYGRWDTEVFGDLVQIYFDKGPAHQIAPGYSSHWAQIMGEGGQRGRVNLRGDLTDEENSILVAALDAAAEAFRRWEVALGIEVGKPEACVLSAKGWQSWLVDTSTVYESPYGFWSPMVTPNQILWVNLECGFWGCYYPSPSGAWEFGFTQTQTHAFFTDGNGNLLISEEDRLELIRAVPQVKMDGERVLVEEADVQRFLATFARILYKNGLGAYVTRVPPAWQEYVGFAGSGTDFAYLARLEAEADRLADFAAEAQAGLDAWYERNPGQEAPAELVEAVQAAHKMAEDASSLLESERERLLGQFPKVVP